MKSNKRSEGLKGHLVRGRFKVFVCQLGLHTSFCAVDTHSSKPQSPLCCCPSTRGDSVLRKYPGIWDWLWLNLALQLPLPTDPEPAVGSASQITVQWWCTAGKRDHSHVSNKMAEKKWIWALFKYNTQSQTACVVKFSIEICVNDFVIPG